MKILHSTFITFAFCMAALSQGKSAEDLQSDAKNMKANKDVIVKYDRFKDQISITTKPQNLLTTGESFAAGFAGSLARQTGDRFMFPTALLVGSGTVIDGKTFNETPDPVYVFFASNSNNWLFLKGDRNLYVIADSKRYEYKMRGHDGDIGGNGVAEQIGFEIPRKELLEIANAKIVEFQLGPIPPRKIKPIVLERFKKFLLLTDTGH